MADPLDEVEFLRQLDRHDKRETERRGYELDRRPGSDVCAVAMRLAANMHDAHCIDLVKVVERTESPIERLFLYGLIVRASDDARFDVRYRLDGREFGTVAYDLGQLVIEPQALVCNYRVDFLIEWRTGMCHARTPRGSLIVECDGFEYHETRQQATRDKRKDRELLDAGYHVYRFTGSELNADALAAGEQVVQHIHNAVYGPFDESDLEILQVASSAVAQGAKPCDGFTATKGLPDAPF